MGTLNTSEMAKFTRELFNLLVLYSGERIIVAWEYTEDSVLTISVHAETIFKNVVAEFSKFLKMCIYTM